MQRIRDKDGRVKERKQGEKDGVIRLGYGEGREGCKKPKCGSKKEQENRRAKVDRLEKK